MNYKEADFSSNFSSTLISILSFSIGFQYVHVHLTQHAVQIVDDVLMFGVVKHRHGTGVILPPLNAQIRGVDRHRRHVSQQMQNKRWADQLDLKCEGSTTEQTNTTLIQISLSAVCLTASSNDLHKHTLLTSAFNWAHAAVWRGVKWTNHESFLLIHLKIRVICSWIGQTHRVHLCLGLHAISRDNATEILSIYYLCTFSSFCICLHRPSVWETLIILAMRSKNYTLLVSIIWFLWQNWL